MGVPNIIRGEPILQACAIIFGLGGPFLMGVIMSSCVIPLGNFIPGIKFLNKKLGHLIRVQEFKVQLLSMCKTPV